MQSAMGAGRLPGAVGGPTAFAGKPRGPLPALRAGNARMGATNAPGMPFMHR